MRTKRQKAYARIMAHESLYKYYDIIMADWHEGDEHWQWVATAPENEIAEWAAAIQQGIKEQEEMGQ